MATYNTSWKQIQHISLLAHLVSPVTSQTFTFNQSKSRDVKQTIRLVCLFLFILELAQASRGSFGVCKPLSPNTALMGRASWRLFLIHCPFASFLFFEYYFAGPLQGCKIKRTIMCDERARVLYSTVHVHSNQRSFIHKMVSQKAQKKGIYLRDSKLGSGDDVNMLFWGGFVLPLALPLIFFYFFWISIWCSFFFYITIQLREYIPVAVIWASSSYIMLIIVPIGGYGNK